MHHNPRRLGPLFAEQCCSAPQSEAIRAIYVLNTAAPPESPARTGPLTTKARLQQKLAERQLGTKYSELHHYAQSRCAQVIVSATQPKR